MSENIVAELREIHRRELALYLVPANKGGEKCVTRIRIDLLSEAADEIDALRGKLAAVEKGLDAAKKLAAEAYVMECPIHGADLANCLGGAGVMPLAEFEDLIEAAAWTRA